MHLAAAPALAGLGLELLVVLEGEQAGQALAHAEADVAAPAAVAAVGAAARDVLLTPEAEAAVPSASGLDSDARSIVKHASAAFGAGG
jgi:hypothetical protein